MRSPFFLAGLPALLVAAGCTVPSPDGERDAEAASGPATALVVVERSGGAGDSARSDSVVARFVRVSHGAVDQSALRVAGVVQDLPAPGSCAVTTETELSSPHGARGVELLDVGALSVGSASMTTSVTPRAMPDLAGVVSGVFYSARSIETFSPGARFTMHAAGGDLGADLAVDVASPHDLSDVRAVPGEGGLEVLWDADGADARDVVYADLIVAGRQPLRCSAFDTGSTTLPSSADEGMVTVHRVHREAFRSAGIDPGEVRFDLARAVTFRR